MNNITLSQFVIKLCVSIIPFMLAYIWIAIRMLTKILI